MAGVEDAMPRTSASDPKRTFEEGTNYKSARFTNSNYFPSVMSTSSLTFKCGTRPVFLDKLHVQQTYEGILVGKPNSDVNRAIRARFEALASGMNASHKPFVVEPITGSSEDSPKLPAYSCLVVLSHPDPVHNSQAHMSFAGIVWYQESDPLVHGFDIVGIARELTWSDVALDGYW